MAIVKDDDGWTIEHELNDPPDCVDCGHSWYDHIGWRKGTPSEGQTMCRIVGCLGGIGCYYRVAVKNVKSLLEGNWDNRIDESLKEFHDYMQRVIAGRRTIKR